MSPLVLTEELVKAKAMLLWNSKTEEMQMTLMKNSKGTTSKDVDYVWIGILVSIRSCISDLEVLAEQEVVVVVVVAEVAAAAAAAVEVEEVVAAVVAAAVVVVAAILAVLPDIVGVVLLTGTVLDLLDTHLLDLLGEALPALLVSDEIVLPMNLDDHRNRLRVALLEEHRDLRSLVDLVPHLHEIDDRRHRDLLLPVDNHDHLSADLRILNLELRQDPDLEAKIQVQRNLTREIEMIYNYNFLNQKKLRNEEKYERVDNDRLRLVTLIPFFI